MKESNSLRTYLVVGAVALMLQCVPALADQMMPMQSEDGMSEHSRRFDWLKHTQHTLDELKGKLNLVPGQMAAWDAWSGGVSKDAHQQLEQKKVLHEEKWDGTKPPADLTTPDLMQRGIEDLRAEIAWMQEHLVQLEAAQARTKIFYGTLDTNQKTIFDLFWHEMYHRSIGHDDGQGMHAHGDFDSGSMKEERYGPAGGTERN